MKKNNLFGLYRGSLVIDVFYVLCDNENMAKKLDAHLKETGCWFVAVSHDEGSRNLLKTNCEDFPFWAWVDHIPDKETEESDKHFHTHLIFRTPGTRRIKDVAEQLQIPGNFVQKCRNKRSMMRYFRHLDNPEKVQYSESDVHSNQPSTLKIAWTDNSDDDVKRLFSDLRKLRVGSITLDQFVDLHYMEIQKMPFYQKIKTYEYIEKIAHLRE